MKLECVDCHSIIEGEANTALDLMEHHVRAAHGRELAFKREVYLRPTYNSQLASALLLNPDLIGAA